jgi:hypothetical protein
MGLTVHYRFSFNGREAQLIDKLIWLSSEFRKLPVTQVHEIAFGRKGHELSVDVGPGCEWFTITLTNKGHGEWQGRGFTKTNLARDFRASHILVISLLDLCGKAGILESVEDESGYWAKRRLDDINNLGS